MSLYPLMLELQGLPCVVIGGGRVAARKVVRLTTSGAAVTVVAPRLEASIEQLAETGHVRAVRRPFQPADLAGARLVFAATDRPAVNAAVKAEASRLGIPTNVADDPAACDFQVPAVVERGGLQLAISTNGRSPAFARRLREELSEWLSPERLELLELYADLRTSLQAETSNVANADWTAVDARALNLLRNGRAIEARQVLLEQITAGTRGEQ